jgi:hypothetical protein
MTAFWDKEPDSLIEVEWDNTGVYFLHHQFTLMMKVVCTSEISVYFYEIT